MDTDYKALCRELFGTDDVTKLSEIAEKIQKKNPRNAGRKRKYSDMDISRMQELRKKGVPIRKIAEQFGTSRQVIGKLLVAEPPHGCTMRMTYMYQQHPCTVIDADFLNRKIYIQNMTDDLIHRAFGVVEQPTWEDFEYFLEDRCFPRTRGNCQDLLKILGIDNYDPLQIIEKTRGRMAEDDLWIKIRYLDRKGGSACSKLSSANRHV